MVDVDVVSLAVDSHPRSVGLVWVSAATWWTGWAPLWQVALCYGALEIVLVAFL